MSQENHIMKHDAVYVIYLAVICTILGVIGASMAFHG